MNRHRKVSGLAMLASVMIAWACDTAREGDHRTVERVEEITGGDVKIVLTSSVTLSTTLDVSGFDGATPGMTEEDAIKSFGEPSAIASDKMGARWAQWSRPGGVLEIGNPDVGSGAGPEVHHWMTRFDPTSDDLAAILKPGLSAYVGQARSRRALLIESPSEHLRLSIALDGGRVRHVYLLSTPG